MQAGQWAEMLPDYKERLRVMARHAALHMMTMTPRHPVFELVPKG